MRYSGVVIFQGSSGCSLDLVATMARLCFEGNDSDALIGISYALHGSIDSLDEFPEVETRLELETADGVDSGNGDNNESCPNFLGVVGGTLKETVVNLVSRPEIRKLLVAGRI
ncbi:hypothetical protein M758_4G040400 [Ceratodon purpureus]|nr:hypothetical protein M758_4G040400 [Ceratodon purpureus]